MRYIGKIRNLLKRYEIEKSISEHLGDEKYDKFLDDFEELIDDEIEDKTSSLQEEIDEYEYDTTSDDLQEEIEEKDEELVELQAKVDYYESASVNFIIVKDGLYLSGIDENNNPQWSQNKIDAIVKDSLYEIKMMAKRIKLNLNIDIY